MAWTKDAISEGELDGLYRAAHAAASEDTRYPAWRGASTHGGGQCYVFSHWLTERLGGHVGANRGHYAWLSPDERYYIDLTAGHTGSWRYERNQDFHRIAAVANARTQRFAKRADRIFDSLEHLIRLALDYAGDAYPAEQPQAADDSDRFADSWNDPEQYWHDEPDPTSPEGLYQFVWASGQLEVSPNHSHADLASHAGIDPAVHTGPFASGHVVVTDGQATWQVQANVNLHAFLKILKDASRQYGWRWGGMTDASGQPITDDFGPSKTSTILHYAYTNHLLLGRTSSADLSLRLQDAATDEGVRPLMGTVRTIGTRAIVDPVHLAALPSLFDWANDSGLTLYAGNDNVIKTIPDLQQHDNYNPQTSESPNPMEPPPVDERLPSGLYSCPTCRQLFPTWRDYANHRREDNCAEWSDPDHMDNGDRGLPEPDPGVYGDGAHFTEMRQEPGITTGSLSSSAIRILPARTWKEAARVDGFQRYAKAFRYDDPDLQFYVAYRNGDPLGYAAIRSDGALHMIHTAVENEGIGSALYAKIMRLYPSLHTNAAHERTAGMLKRRGWLQVSAIKWKWSKGTDAKDMLEAPIPFIYDADKGKIFTGHPGARTSDIPGRFTPGGIVEGVYEPGGKIVIRTITSVPYTVNFLVRLWYATNPHLEVKSVHLQDDAGKDTKLASVGQQLQMLAAISPAAHAASLALTQAGGEVYVVGGAVRDVVMGKEPKDLDLMVTGLPSEKVSHILQSLPGRVDHTGKDFGVFRYKRKGEEVEIALPRTERSTGEGHKDFHVAADHSLTPEQDFARRDFTANAMGVNLRTGELLDPHDGQSDIKQRILRATGPLTLAEDPLRVLRGLVLYARHGLMPAPATRERMQASAGGLTALPAERVQVELDKLMASPNPAGAIRLAHQTGVLAHVLPEVAACMGYDQANPHHELELGEHLLKVLERVATKTEDPDLRMAALLHDIGKPGSAWKDPETGSNHYYAKHLEDGTILGAQHEDLGAELARARLSALRYPTDRIARIVALVANHMYAGYSTMAGARRFLSRVGDHADDLFLLRWADQGGKDVQPHHEPEIAWNVDANRRLVSKVRAAGQAFDRSGLAINGRDLIAAGLEGKAIGQTLSSLTQRVIEDPSLNERDTLLRLAVA